MRSRRLHRLVTRAKRLLLIGAPFDNSLNYIQAWNQLEYRPNLVEPRSLNELILTSKWRFRGDMNLARRVTDKVEFKEWLRETPAWEDLVIPTIGVYGGVDEVRGLVFTRDTILKPTHLSGRAILFEEDRALDAGELAKVGRWLRRDYYRRSREPNYKGLRKRLICEPVLRDETGSVPIDYKFFMIGGRPLVIQVDLDRFGNRTQQYYSPDWRLLDFTHGFPRNPFPLDRPVQMSAALDTASVLAQVFPLCRVDLYLLPEGAIKAGEITFFPHGGASPFSPPSADFELGRMARELSGTLSQKAPMPCA